MSTKKFDVKPLVFAGLFAALIYVATSVIQIKTPTDGYLNMGDCFILLGAWLLGPFYGFAAGGIGSALCDLLSGYTHYVVGTFIIKGLMAVLAVYGYKVVYGMTKNRIVAYIISGIVTELWMVFGYFLYKATVLGAGLGAAAGIPGNLVQGTFGVVAGTIITVAVLPILHKQGIIAPYIFEEKAEK